MLLLPVEGAGAPTEIEMPSQMVNVAFSPREPLFAAHDMYQKKVVLWDYAKNEERGRLASEAAVALAFDSEGKRLAMSGETQISVVALPGLKDVLHFDTGPTGGEMQLLQWSADGEHLISLSGISCQLNLWELSPDKLLAPMPSGGSVSKFLISPDSRWLAAEAEDGLSVRLLNSANGTIEHEFHDEQKWQSLVFRQDSQRFAVLSDSGLAIVYDVQTHKEIARQTMRGRCHSGVFNADGDLLVSVFDNPYYSLWNLSSNQIVGVAAAANIKAPANFNSEGSFSKIGEPCFSGDGRWVVIKREGFEAETPGSVWELATGKQVAELKGSLKGDDVLTSDFLCSPTNRWVVAAAIKIPSIGGLPPLPKANKSGPPGADAAVTEPDPNSVVTMWNAQNGDKIWVAPTSQYVTPQSFSPDGRFLAIQTRDGQIMLFDSSQAEERFRFRRSGISGLSFSPNGKYLVWNDTSKNVIESLDMTVLRQLLVESGLSW